MKKGLSRHMLVDEIYALVKEKIINHEIAPGEKINIDQLGRDLQVSNIPIRESLARLAAEGLVDTIPFKGMFVTKLSLQDLDEMFEIRAELEGLAIRKAAPHIPVKKVEKLQSDMRKWADAGLADNGERIRFVAKMNERLHGLILEYCGNSLLRGLIRSYIEKVQRYLSLSRTDLEQAIVQLEWEEHMRIVQSLAMQDAEAAEQALEVHLRNSHARTRKFL